MIRKPIKLSAISAFILLVCSVLSLGACAPSALEPDAADNENAALELTLDELSVFNGKDGQPAYIAIDGVIYDVTSIPNWKDGEHNGFFAGQDLTEEIKTRSPHGVSKLNNVPVVGKLKP